jgi:hypothetical protein
MKQTILLLLLVVFCLSMISCAPVTLSKCIKEYRYTGDKLTGEYSECLTQTPEKTSPVHLKHQELYD